MGASESVNSGSTRVLAKFVSEMSVADLPAEVVARAKDCILDWTGCAFAGIGSPTDRGLRPAVGALLGPGGATLVGTGLSAAPLGAALFNGAVSAVGEIDDVHELVSLHPGIGVIPAALAAAEPAGAPGAALILGVVLGYDVAVRVARAAGESHYRIWHATGTCDTFGAAAAAGKVFGLDAERQLMALGLAGTQAAGLWESLTTSAVTAKHLHSGKAAADGLLAAALARNGLRGSSSILEGPLGFLAAASTATPEDIVGLTRDLGAPFLITRTFFKRYACCKACIDPIDGLLDLMSTHGLPPEEVASVTVTLRPENYRLVGNSDPRDVSEARFSAAFCLSLAALTGGASVHNFTLERLNDPVIRQWMRRVRVEADPSLPVRSQLTIRTAGGQVLQVTPPIRSLPPSEIRGKFREVVRPLLSARRAAEIADRVDTLETLPDIRELTRLLRRSVR